VSSTTIGSSAVPRNCGIELMLVDDLDARAECSEECVRRLEEVDGVCPIVHRHDESRPRCAHDRGSRLAADGRTVPDGKEQHVDPEDRPPLLDTQLGLAEVAEVAEAQTGEREAEDRVRAAPGARNVVVFRGHSDNLTDRRLEGAGGRAKNLRRAADHLDSIVVDVLVRHEQQFRLHILDRRVVEAQTPLREDTHVAEGVDEDGSAAVDQKR
jgi:hypothetical protein